MLQTRLKGMSNSDSKFFEETREALCQQWYSNMASAKLGSELRKVSSQIPNTADGSPFVKRNFDLNFLSVVAPDHLLTGIGWCLIEICVFQVEDKRKQEQLESSSNWVALSYIQGCHEENQQHFNVNSLSRLVNITCRSHGFGTRFRLWDSWSTSNSHQDGSSYIFVEISIVGRHWSLQLRSLFKNGTYYQDCYRRMSLYRAGHYTILQAHLRETESSKCSSTTTVEHKLSAMFGHAVFYSELKFESSHQVLESALSKRTDVCGHF